MASRIIIDGDPLVGIAETDPRTEHIVGPLGSLAQAESMCDGINGVVILTRRGDGFHVLKPPIDVAFASHDAGAARARTRRLGRCSCVSPHECIDPSCPLASLAAAQREAAMFDADDREQLGHGLGEVGGVDG